MCKSRIALAIVSLLLISGWFLISAKPALAAPFTCTTGLYQEISGQLRVLDLSSNTFTTIGPNHGININAMGYNPVDNYIYGMVFSNSHLLRIEDDGTYTDLGVPTGLPVTGYNAGDFDQAGNLYIKSAGNLYRIDVVANTATQIVLSSTFASAELVHINGYLYGVGTASDAGNLFRVDITNGNVTSVPVALPGTGGYGAGWATDTTSLYFSNNTTGVVYKVTDYTTTPVVTAVMNSTPSIENDGAACFSAPTPIPDVLAYNKTGATSFDQQLVVPASAGLLIGDSGRDITVTSYTQPPNGTVVVSPDGSYTYTPNAGFSGNDTFSYTITDAFGTSASANVTITVGAATVSITGSLANTGSNQQIYILLGAMSLLVGLCTLYVALKQSST